jgi:uncharacterized protein with FMN-binding domain
MRRITLWFMSTVGALVLLFSYRTSTQSPAQEAVDASQARPAPAPTGGGPAKDDDKDAGKDADARGDDRDGEDDAADGGTYEGTVAQTPEGPVQVSITVAAGKITDIAVLTRPSGAGRHEEVNGRALPILKDEALQKQSADIDTVSGATATSGGYKESLQAAIDAANL